MSETNIPQYSDFEPQVVGNIALAHDVLKPGFNLSETYTTAIQNVMESVHATYPEFVGFTIFGSLSRGEAVVKGDGSCSDIDGAVIIDADRQPAIRDSMTPIAESGRKDILSLVETGVGADIKVWLMNMLMTATGVDENPDIRLVVVSKELLSQKPRELLELATEPDKAVEDWLSVDESVKDCLRYFGRADLIRSLFHVDAYGSEALAKYRKMVIGTLLEYQALKPRVVDRAWVIIKSLVEYYEKGGEGDSMMRPFPQNLSEAAKFYGLEQ